MPSEVTQLTPLEEELFRAWVAAHPSQKGWDQPDSKYDIRGMWKDPEAMRGWRPGAHGTDRYKQHGHPTFSVESQYSRGLWDGGQWIPGAQDEKGLIGPPMPSHQPDQRAVLLELLRKR